MRKSAVVIPVFALLAGVIGFLLRKMEVNTMFEAATGFAKRGSVVSSLLIALAAVVIVLSLLCGVVISRKMKAEADYCRAFEPGGFVYLALSFVLSAAWLAAVVWITFNGIAGGTVTALVIIYAFLGVLTAVSMIFMARGAYKGRGGGELMLFSTIPPLFFCFWLILVYKNNVANPVILRFAYQCLALAAAALGAYFSAGFVFGKAAAGKTLFSFLVTIFFSAVVLADDIPTPEKIIYAVMLLGSFINAVALLRNLRGKYET